MSDQGKSAIVTGASSGIGLATARAFLEQGFNVVMIGSNPERLATAFESLGRPEAASGPRRGGRLTRSRDSLDASEGYLRHLWKDGT